LGKLQTDSFKTERLVCVETDGQADMAKSTCLVMIKNIYMSGYGFDFPYFAQIVYGEYP